MSANREQKVMSIRERERYRNMISEKKSQLNGQISVPTHKGIREGVPSRRMGRYSQFLRDDVHEDAGRLKRDINRLERALEEGSPHRLTGSQKMALEKQVQRDREFLRSKMCPKSLFYLRNYNDPEFEKAKQACKVEHTPQYQKVAERYKNAMRRIDPDNEKAGNLEDLRPS